MAGHGRPSGMTEYFEIEPYNQNSQDWPSKIVEPLAAAGLNARSSSFGAAGQSPVRRHAGHQARGEEAVEPRWPRGIALARIWQSARKERRLPGTELIGAFAKVMPRRRLGAENPVPPFRDVEIDFQDALLGPLDPNQKRQGDLDRLAQIGSRLP